MDQKDLLVDRVTMELQQKLGKTFYGGNLKTPAFSLHNYRRLDGEHFTKQGQPAKRLPKEHDLKRDGLFTRRAWLLIH